MCPQVLIQMPAIRKRRFAKRASVLHLRSVGIDNAMGVEVSFQVPSVFKGDLALGACVGAHLQVSGFEVQLN